MKRFYTNTAAKLLAFCLAAALTLGAVMLVFCAVNNAVRGCLPGQSYEDSEAYRGVMTDYIVATANLYRLEGEDLSENSGLSYVARQERQESRTALEQWLLDGAQSNFRFEIRSEDGRSLYGNLQSGESFESLGITPQYVTVQDGQMTGSGNVDLPNSAADVGHLFCYYNWEGYYRTVLTDAGAGEAFPYVYEFLYNEEYSDEYDNLDSASADSYILCWGVLPEYPASDALSVVRDWYLELQSSLPGYLFAAALCAVLAVFFLVFVCRGAGRRRETDGVALRWTDRVPFELVLLVLGGAGGLGVAAAVDFPYSIDDSTRVFLVGALVSYCAVLLELCLVTVAVRVKARAFWRRTLLGKLGGLCARFFRSCADMVNHAELTWKFVLFYVGYEFLSLLLCLRAHAPGIFFLLAIVNFFVLLLGCRWAVKFGAVREGAAELAKGNLAFRIETRRLPAALREHAEDLNHISDGMAAALDEQMKSERMKSELITNVSHDIKTPLTSIINYVGLLQAEPAENEKSREYLAVLDRQSKRLKKLTDDLVDASKASSGAMPVHWENVDALELLEQAAGEYSGRLAERNLTPVLELPPEPLIVRADGTLLWRVIDNLLSNICKYAMPETRVYLSLTRRDGAAVILVKNVSRAPLNIPADELMERFVRGDSSRSSEGSGLGLSIAQSLTELMGGAFRLEIDGDLFKAELTSP